MKVLYGYGHLQTNDRFRWGHTIMPRLGKIVFSHQMGFVLVLIFIFSVIAGETIAAEIDKPSLFATVLKWLPLIFKGFLMNIMVSVLSMTIGTISGVVLGMGLVSLTKYTRKISWFLTEFFRNSPWLVLVFYTIFLIPFEINIGTYIIPFPGWLKATIGLSLPVMANIAEIVRGGIQSIPVGQWESSESLAFSRFQTLWFIILPQSIKRMIPPWMNLYAILITASPLISLVGVYDALLMTRSALMAEGRSELLLPMYSVLLIMFFMYCYPIAYYTVKLEHRFAVKI